MQGWVRGQPCPAVPAWCPALGFRDGPRDAEGSMPCPVPLCRWPHMVGQRWPGAALTAAPRTQPCHGRCHQAPGGKERLRGAVVSLSPPRGSSWLCSPITAAPQGVRGPLLPCARCPGRGQGLHRCGASGSQKGLCSLGLECDEAFQGTFWA